MKYNLLVSIIFLISSTYVQASLINASAFGYNTTDATAAFQAAINADFDTIVVDLQTADWNIGPSTFFSIEDKTIIFEPEVRLKAIAGAFGNPQDCLVRFVDGSNIELTGYQATFQMNKDEYAILNDSEYRHCLSLFNCINISIKGLTFRDSGGDGIYVGGENNGGRPGYCENITVEDIACVNNYRQGMSIASVENMTVKHALFTETSGALPEAGLDIEPYETYQRVINVNFEHCAFTNNGWSGIAVALFEMDGSSLEVSINFKDCYLKNNRRPDNVYAASEIHLSADPISPVQGKVSFERCVIDGSDWTALYSRKTADAYEAVFKDCVFQNVSREQIEYNEPIFFEVPDYDNPSAHLGGYVFDSLLITYETDFSFLRVFGWNTLEGLKDISGHFTVVEPNDNNVLYSDVPELINVDYTFSNQTILPETTIEWSTTDDLAFECDGTPATFIANRVSTDLSYPLAIYYDTTGTVSFGDDIHLMTTGLVIPAHDESYAIDIEARDDSIEEIDEQVQLSTKINPLYSLGIESTIEATVSDCETLLPVEYLKELQARLLKSKVELRWTTREEYNHNYFFVQRLDASGNFQTIGKVEQPILSSNNQRYIFYDQHPHLGLNYYRLKQVDFNEAFSYSSVVSIQVDRPVIIYPNPTDAIINIQTNLDSYNRITLFNAVGKIIQQEQHLTDLSTLNISDLPKGIYLIKLESTNHPDNTLHRIIKH